jgi:hypothetical protein
MSQVGHRDVGGLAKERVNLKKTEVDDQHAQVNRLSDRTVVFTTPRSVGVRSEAGWLAAMAVADYRPPTWPEPDVPKQIHLDLAVDDLEAAVAEAIRCGATPAAVQPAPEARRILLDPAGHPFCLTTMIPRGARVDPD